MEISKKLKQLMKVLLVVLMSLTVIVPDGIVKAEDYLLTNKTSYEYGEQVLVTVQNIGKKDGSIWTWVGLFKDGEDYTNENTTSTSWYYYVKDDPINILSDYSVEKSEGKVNIRSNINAGGDFVVVLYGESGGYTDIKATQKIHINPKSKQYIITNKDEYQPNEPIMVSLSDNFQYTGYVWVALYSKDEKPGLNNSVSIRYLDNDKGFDLYTPHNIIEGHNDNSKPVPSTGEYDIVLMYEGDPDGYYNVFDRETIKITSSVPNTLVLNKEAVDGVATFKYSDPIIPTATSGNPNAFVGLYDRTPPKDVPLADCYYTIAKLSEMTEPVDLLKKALDEGKTIVPGDYRVYLFDPTTSNPFEIATDPETGNFINVKIKIIPTYFEDNDHIDWTLSEDKTTATAVFHRMDNDAESEPFTTTTVIEKEPIAPTCTEPGYDVYEATLMFTNDNMLVTPNDTMSFTKDIKVETLEPLGHDWGELIIDVEPTEETAGSGHKECTRCGESSPTETIPPIGHIHSMTHVEAKAPTCTEPGNIEHYHCEKCGNNYRDEAGEEYLVDVTVPALGHDYGTPVFDKEKHNHYRVCTRCDDKIEEDCTFVDSYAGGTVVHTCSVCGGSYEEKFLWTDKQVYKQYEPIITSVDLNAVSNYEGLVADSAWVGIYPSGEVPAKDMSIRWHYVKNMGEGLDIWAILTYGGEESKDHPGQGSGSTNGRNDYLTTAGDYVIYLLADGGFDKRIGYVTVTLTEETLAADEIKFEFNGKEQEMGQKNEFVLPIDTMNFKVSTENAYGAWVGIYKAEYEKDFDFASITSDWWKYIKDINNNVIDLKDICGEAGKYTLVVYGSGGHNDIRNLIYIEVTKAIVEEKVTVEPTCTEAGNKRVTYSDGTTENIQIPALGHEWGEFKFDGEEAKTHSKECSRCHEKVTEDCTFTAEEKDGVITYTCEVCGGQYTYKKTVADEDVYRTSGPDRYLTALKAAVVFMEKTKKEKLDTVVLACGTNFADALAGSYLAAVKNAPILLIDDNKQATTVENFIKENVVEGGLVYILGGEKAVAPKFESDLKKAGLNVKRLMGATRYETNIEILKEAGIRGDTILVSVGTNFADSLSASASGYPVLLVKDALTKEQKDFLKEYKGKKIYILGGPNAVKKTVEGEMGEYGTVKRVQGETRYETSTKIAETFFPQADTVLLAVGDNFPDGLCGGALAYQLHAPVILTKEGNVSFAKKYVARNNITKAVVLGGVNAQKDTLVNDIMGRDPKAEIKEYE